MVGADMLRAACRYRVSGQRAVCGLLLLLLIGGAVPPAAMARPADMPADDVAVMSAEWSGFQPSGWVTSVPFSSSVTASDPSGLDPSWAEWQTSADGGAWSDWSGANISVGGSISTTQSITVTNLALPDSANNQIAFRIRSTLGITLTSPAYALSVDTAPPANPVSFASSSHSAAAWSKDPTVDLHWAAGTDATSGVAGYALLWDHAPSTLPGPPTTTAALSATSPPLADGTDHYVHLRTADHAGLWAADALHLGPFQIDTQAPQSAVTYPVHGATYAGVATITGTAADLGSSGVALVEVLLTDLAAGKSWNGSAWAAGETWLAANGTTTWQHSAGLPPWANGKSYGVRSRATDAAGNVEAAGPGVSFTIDSGGPAAPIGLTATPAGWTKVDSFDLHWSNPSDPAGIAGAWTKLDTPPAHASDGTYVSGAGLTSISGLGVGGDGAHDLWLWLQDGLGNADHTTAARVTLHLDRTAPGTPLNLAANPVGWTNVDLFGVTWTNPDELSGVAGAWYKIGNAPLHGSDGVFVSGAGLTQITGLSLGSEGARDLFLWLQDALGQTDHTRAATVKLSLDTTAPGAPTGLDSEPNGWQKLNDFSVTWRNPADLSGIAGAYWRLDSEPAGPRDGTFVAGVGLARIDHLAMSSEGQHDLYLWLSDAADNVDQHNRNVLIRAFWYDATPPVTEVSLTGPAGLSGWYTGAVAGALLPQDAVSGVAGSSYRIDGGAWISNTLFALNDDGVHTVDYRSWDVAGNREADRVAVVSLDRQPPLAKHALSGLPGPGGWYSSTVTVTLTISDATSGPAAIFARVDGGAWNSSWDTTDVVFATDGDHRLEYYGQDWAGNKQATQQVAVPIDMRPPQTAYQLDGAEGLAGWFTSVVTVTLMPADTVSGVVGTYYRLNGGAWQSGTTFVIAEDGVHTLEFYSVDGLGNRERFFPVTLRVDAHAPGAPTRPQPSPAIWTKVNDFSIVWANPQDVSGIGGACYKLDAEPRSSDDGTCQDVAGNTLHHIQVPTEGAHDVYLWLRDVAGNIDHDHRNVALDALRYDATAPQLSMVVSGTMGWDDWYISPVTLTFEMEDELSGPYSTRYRIDGGPWLHGLQATIATEDKHVVQYFGLDVAGNQGITQTTTLRMDLHAPNPPIGVGISPSGWSRENRFRVTWSNPVDFSGIAAAIYRFKTPPATGFDGTLVTATSTITDIVAPEEGQHDLYLWLADGAGNASPTHWAMLPQAVWYDGTPPTTTLTISGTLGSGGWYTSDLDVLIAVEEQVSGVAKVRYRVDDGAWATGTSFSLMAEGPHTVRHSATDVAGNVEMTRTTSLGIDRQPPRADIVGLSPYQSTAIFAVQWQGDDGPLGSGVVAYDVQVRQGQSGSWLAWLVNTPLTSAFFAGQPGKTYYFRVRAHDAAGHSGEYPGGDGNARTAVQIVQNGGFENPGLAPWVLSGELSSRSAVSQTVSARGERTRAVRLGSAAYGASTDLEKPGSVPVGAAVISQTVTVPGPGDMVAPTLTLWYRIYSYDVLWSEWNQRFYDTFEVTIRSSGGITPALVLRDGNDVGPNPVLGVDYGVLKDLGWRYGLVDLTAYAGQTIQITFANHNRWDHHFNTWTFLDDVQIEDREGHLRCYVPLVAARHEALAAAAAVQERPRQQGPRPR